MSGLDPSDFHRRAVQRVAAIRASGQFLCTTRVNIAELYVGVELSSQPALELERVNTVIRGLTVLELDEAAARRFGTIAAYLQRSGRPAGDMDVLIAAIAQVNGQGLLTPNPKHFVNVPGFDVQTY